MKFHQLWYDLSLHKIKSSEAALNRELARTIKRNLLPQTFPLRREIEFAAALDNRTTGTNYYDTLWLDARTVAIAVLHMTTGGLDGAMKAAALKSLLRAALIKFCDPAKALEACQDIDAFSDLHAVVIIMDLRTGITFASTQGQSKLFLGDGNPAPLGEMALAPGTSLNLIIGDVRAVPGSPQTGMVSVFDLAQQTLRDVNGAVAVATVLYKQVLRPSGVETATFANEYTEIPRALAWLERFCEHQTIEWRAVAGIDLALDEVLANIISYAFPDSALHRIEVEAVAANNRLSLEIRDDGTHFDPLKIPPPALDADLVDREVGGLGIHFVKTIVDTITYNRDEGWNVLRLSKKIDSNDSDENST